MAWTTEDLEAIETAIATGTTSVSFRDRSVTYRSLDELYRVRRTIRRDLGLETSSGSGFGARGIYTKTSKGL